MKFLVVKKGSETKRINVNEIKEISSFGNLIIIKYSGGEVKIKAKGDAEEVADWIVKMIADFPNKIIDLRAGFVSRIKEKHEVRV
ncbi:hypothetical protein [Methanocaldococcus fervens]|nr:hypothetical protein [Methanocaldococcus fervens]ACV25370.1 hypothetical protein Mefer_1567 [Methanocaldococcus fervens AG86]